MNTRVNDSKMKVEGSKQNGDSANRHEAKIKKETLPPGEAYIEVGFIVKKESESFQVDL